MEIVGEIKDERMSTQENTEQYYNQQMLQKAIAVLPETQKEVIIFKYVNELDNKEIAAILGKTETAIRTLLSHAIAKLKEVMQKLNTKI